MKEARHKGCTLCDLFYVKYRNRKTNWDRDCPLWEEVSVCLLGYLWHCFLCWVLVTQLCCLQKFLRLYTNHIYPFCMFHFIKKTFYKMSYESKWPTSHWPKPFLISVWYPSLIFSPFLHFIIYLGRKSFKTFQNFPWWHP